MANSSLIYSQKKKLDMYSSQNQRDKIVKLPSSFTKNQFSTA
jgi:hypothetical protein